MNNLVRSVLLAGTLLTTSLQGLHADTKSHVSGTQKLVSASLNKKSQTPIITTEDLKSPNPPKKFKDIVKEILKDPKNGGNLSILVEDTSLDSSKEIIKGWLKKLGVSQKKVFGYSNKEDEEGNNIDVINSLKDAIANFSTRVIIITDKAGEDWDYLNQISGVKIIIFFINQDGISCKETPYHNNKKFPKDSKCIDVKPM